MKVRDLMARPLRTVEAADSIAEAASAMAGHDVGVLPVIEDGSLVGIVTDRDILVRAMAQGLRSRTSVRAVMTARVLTCTADDEVEDVLRIMADQQIRRMPVCSVDGRLLGVFSIGDAARTEEYQELAAAALANICRPHGRHCQRPKAA